MEDNKNDIPEWQVGMPDWQIKLLREYEEKYGHYLEGFYKIACKILADHPEQYQEFEKQWKLKNFRWAFLQYSDIVYKYKTSKYILTPEEKYIEQEFYGLFVN